MKKIGSIAAALLLTSSLYAQQQGSNGFYVGAGIGLEAMPKHVDDGVGLAIKGGVELDNVLKNLGVEAELSTSLVAPEISNSNNKIDVTTLGVYATYTIDIPGSAFKVRPKFGLILPNLGDELHSRGDLAISGGIAGMYELNNQLDLYVEYVNTSEAMNNYMIGLAVNF
ncbi:porin family protein [Sulfurimonas sp. HSL-3221]|uniref:outer membrane beta-barrel protein n=1 Tax=Sulfurimonadaceae TaxID=2771471 RepID=UPI001E4ABB98|nr:outer membrane beta-barrel protein [Sulfurimonas sp. HSL-3221]UFS61693.1 porin family protein [Sulfurimonas sp. HSL-3221]